MYNAELSLAVGARRFIDQLSVMTVQGERPMSTGTEIPMTCQHCGRPIAKLSTHIGHLAYHPECTHGHGHQMHYAPMPPAPGAHPFAPVSEERVRQIVREELQRLNPGGFRCG